MNRLTNERSLFFANFFISVITSASKETFPFSYSGVSFFMPFSNIQHQADEKAIDDVVAKKIGGGGIIKGYL